MISNPTLTFSTEPVYLRSKILKDWPQLNNFKFVTIKASFYNKNSGLGFTKLYYPSFLFWKSFPFKNCQSKTDGRDWNLVNLTTVGI